MGNCLVTKLKSVVNNDALPRLGFMKLHVNAAAGDSVGSRTFTIFCTAPTKIYTEAGNKLALYGSSDKTNELTIPNSGSITVEPGEYDVYIEKYNITRVAGSQSSAEANLAKSYSFDVSQLEYSVTNSVYLTNCAVSGELKVDLNRVTVLTVTTSISGIDSSKDDIIFNVDYFRNATLTAISASCRNIVGSLDSLHNVTGNISLNGRGTQMRMTGDIKTFVEYMASHGVQNAIYEFRTANMDTTLYHDGNLFTNVYVNQQGGAGKASGVKYTITEGVLSSPEWL